MNHLCLSKQKNSAKFTKDFLINVGKSGSEGTICSLLLKKTNTSVLLMLQFGIPVQLHDK